MRRFALALMLLAVLILPACSGGAGQPSTGDSPPPETTPVVSDTPAPTPAVTPAPTPTATADPVWGEHSFIHDYTAEDGEVVLSVSYRLPMVVNAGEYLAGEAINRWYQDEASARINEAEDAYELALSDYAICRELDMPFQSTTQEMTYEVTRQDDTVVSIRREWYVNTGGPHPSVFRLSEQFDPVTGARLGFADFFTDADAVSELAIRALTGEYGLERAVIAAAFQPENFYFTDSGCTFWIQGGQIAGAGAGPLEAGVSYDGLTDWLRHG